MSGSVRISRDLFEDTAFKREPFTEREAFVWLIMEASFKPRMKRVGTAEISLERGQLVASFRFMAEAFQWSEARVRRYFQRLKNRRMIDAATDAGINVVTVCKYEDYQAGLKQTDAPQKQKSTQQRRTTDANENKGEIKDNTVIANAIPEQDAGAKQDIAREFSEMFWPAYPHKIGKPVAFDKFEIARRSTSLEAIMAGLSRYVASKPPDRNWCNPATWLHQARWTDEPAQPPVTGASYVSNRPTHTSFLQDLDEAFVDLAALRGEHLAPSPDLARPMASPGGVREREISLGRREGGDYGDDRGHPLRVVSGSRY